MNKSGSSDGDKPKKKPCTICNGKKTVGVGFGRKTCPHCSGTGYEPCTVCKGEKTVRCGCGTEICTHCDGTGFEPEKTEEPSSPSCMG